MNYINWLTAIFVLHFVHGDATSRSNNRWTGKCPDSCVCFVTEGHRNQTICSEGNMKKIPDQEFDLNVNIIEIYGPKNSFAIGPIFTHLKDLEVLRIIDSNVPAVGRHSFWGNPKLRILDLQKNNITQLSDDNFQGQANLIELDLSKNKLERMPSAVFQYLTSLKILNLADNSIEELVPRQFYKLAKLRYLDLSGNPLDDLIPDVFKDIQTLKVLKCRGCQLKKMNPQLYNLVHSLTELDFGDNQFRYFDKTEFRDLKYLKKLRLDGNQLPVIVNHLFTTQKSLEYLDVSRNRLAKLPDLAFEHLHNLTYLDLSYNKLSVIDAECFQPLTNLNILNISGNSQMDLDALRPMLQVLHSLTTLSIADIGFISTGLFIQIGQLKSLNISGNHLTNTSLHILDLLPHLEMLDLSRNQLSGIDGTYAEKLHQIQDVKLDNNPLICDMCHMGPLINKSKELIWQALPICFLPETIRGNSINSLDAFKLDECVELILDEDTNAASTSLNFLEQVLVGNMNWLMLSSSIAFVLIAVIILISAMCYSRHRARYYTHEEKRNDSAAEKTLETTTISDSEINFKFPLNERVCTIDEICLPPAPPPPTKNKPPILIVTDRL